MVEKNVVESAKMTDTQMENLSGEDDPRDAGRRQFPIRRWPRLPE